ncbi:Sideroflexin-3 [Durusdinium trenchii]|uniref:Sideroflexin-3 n=1 Tax=Durusdinium trenchii TaxID=1381693 RepID=A0ABP0PSC7_9DINO
MAPSPKPRTSTWAKPIAGSAYQAWRKPLAAGAAGLAFYSGPCLADGAAQEKGLEDGKTEPLFTEPPELPFLHSYDEMNFYWTTWIPVLLCRLGAPEVDPRADEMGMYDYIDPRTLLLSSEDLKKSQETWFNCKPPILEFVEGSHGHICGGELSAFVPMNVPLCAFMLMANGTPQVLAAQWLNQTYNMVNNYVNRSGATVEWDALLKSYALAVTASCSIAAGSGRLMKAVPALQVMGPFVPYLAVISAGTANVRVAIADEEGKELGMSRAAGQMGVLQTVLSRSCFLPIAPMVMPIVGMKMIGSVAPALTAGAAGVVVEILPLGSGAFCARGVAVKTKPAVRLMCEEVSVVQLDDFLGWTRGSSDLRESIRALKTSRNLSTKR